jgi:hypothetical protein
VSPASLLAGQDFRSYRDAHKGETVWVLGSGATLGHVDSSFFDDKICVCVNYSGTTKGLRQFYTVSNHYDDSAAIANARPDLPVVTSAVEQMPDGWVTNLELTQANIVKVPTVLQSYGGYSVAQHWPEDPDLFTIGPTSAHLALNWAEYLGAAHIMLAGIDCGELSGVSRMSDYPTNPDGSAGHLHFQLWERTLQDIAARLRRDGISVHSLNPFVSLALEGHTFRND